MIQEAPKPTPYMLRLMEDDYYLVCDVERRGVMHIVDGRGRVFLKGTLDTEHEHDDTVTGTQASTIEGGTDNDQARRRATGQAR